MRVQGAIIGCTVCWRMVGFACGAVSFAGLNPCEPNTEIVALARYYWEQARAAGESSPDVERIVLEFRRALRGQSGGRHASDS